MINVPKSPKTYFTTYAGLKGVDYSAPKTEVSRYRASDILNMLPEDGEYVPVKRPGWRTDYTFDSKVETAFHDAYRHMDLICSQNKVYRYYHGTYSEISAVAFKHIVPFNGTIYFYGTNGIYKLNDDNAGLTKQDPTIPWTMYGMNPDGTNGTAYYGVNALTSKRYITFVGDASSVKYYPHADGLTGFKTVIEKAEIRNGTTGEWSVTTAYTLHSNGTVSALNESGVAQTVTTHDYIQFNAAHESTNKQDNIRLTIRELDTTIYSGSTIYGDYCRLGKKILDSDIIKSYGAVNMDRIFVVVDNNKVYYSDTSDIMFYPDDNYLVAGSASPIVGLSRKNNYLVAVTGDSSNHAVFLIKSATAVVTETVTNENGAPTSVSKEQQYFSVYPATSGRGAIAIKSFDTLIDEPLFLGSTGIYAITNNALNTETILMNRSTYINSKLMKEPSLKNAIACVWKSFYILCVNNHCYILDSRVITKDAAGNRCYECYYWEGVPATSVLAYGDNLWFGQSDGKWCRFNTDIPAKEAYVDNGTWIDHGDEIEYVEDTGTPVTCRYTTMMDDDNLPQYFKTMNKKGAVCTLIQQTASSVKIYYSKDNADFVLFTKVNAQATDTREIDVYPLKKVKKYRRLALSFVNDKMEPFGLIKFVKGWQKGNYSKR